TRRQCDTAGIGQSDVEQHQVDRNPVGRRLAGCTHRVTGGMGDGRNRKAFQPFQIRLMRLGDQWLVLDDQHADHEPLTVTVTTDPYVTSADRFPLWRLTTCATSASPRPCCPASEPDLVE